MASFRSGVREGGEEMAARLKEWSHFLVDYVLLGEGTVDNPQRVTKTLQSIMTEATDKVVKET